VSLRGRLCALRAATRLGALTPAGSVYLFGS